VKLEKLGEDDFERLDVKVEKVCCELCQEKFFIPANLKLHKEKEHEKSPVASKLDDTTCMFCKKVFSNKNSVNNHLRQFHKGRAFWCKFKSCVTAFKTAQELDRHLKKRHSLKGRKPIECKKCSYWIVNNTAALEKHMKHHEKIETKEKLVGKIFSCLFCPEKFKKLRSLFSHTKDNHKEEAIKCQNIQCIHFFKSKIEME